MNTIKSLLAVSVLATAGVASAATVATFDVTLTSTTTSAQAAGTINGTGTATLDSSGVLTMLDHIATNLVLFGTVPATATLDATTVFTGTLTGNSLAWTTGTNTLSNCVPGTNGGLICGGSPVGPQPTTLDQNPIVFNLAAIGSVTSLTGNVADPTNASHYTLTATSVPSVPVPAAAWLFGSGLLGLAGTARRRSA